jgi:protein gp37
MGQQSAIEWTDATWNPWQGCTKISPACEHCYMFSDLKRYGRDGSIVVRSKPPTFTLPVKRRRGGEFAIEPGKKVFTCSWSDWFHQAADPWRDEAWEIIRRRPDVTFQIVTKRIDRAADCLPSDWGTGWPNVWLIVTVENQEWADMRIPRLLCSTPAAVRGLSIEPLLGPVDLETQHYIHDLIGVDCHDGRTPEHRMGVDWVIVGGESGHGARPMQPDWVRSIRDQCVAAGVPFFFKQWGEWLPPLQDGGKIKDGRYGAGYSQELNCSDEAIKVGKKAAGRMLDGRHWSQFPGEVPPC